MPDNSSTTETESDRPAIMVVDDRPEALVAMKRALEDLPAEIVTASSGQEAVALALRDDYALILLDVQMPVMDGFATAELIRLNKDTRDIPIIFVTAFNQDRQSVFRGYDAGAVDFLDKPLDPRLLRSKVRVFLDLYRQRMELERSNQALHAFAAIAAHDLRAPLRHVRLWIRFLREDHDDELSDEVKQTLDKVEASAQRMDELVSGLLRYAELDAGKPVFQPVDLQHEIEDLVRDFRDTIASANATVECVDIPDVTGHAMLLRLLFQNLLTNALKYRREGVSPRIVIRGRVDAEGRSVISVEDNGIGFDNQQRSRIFQPFQRLVSRPDIEGSGIGLSAAKRIVDMHGGTITATGEPGVGATFTVTLPAPVPVTA